MNWNVGTKIAAGFGLTLMIFVIVGGFSYHSTTQLIEVSDARKHTSDVLTQITEMLSLLTDVEVGDRGYVITGEESYLQPYQDARAKLDSLMQEIRKMTASNPSQQQRLDLLYPLVKNRLAVARANVDARRTKGVQAATALIKSGEGKAVMDKIRKVLGEMQSEEEGILQTRVDQAETGAQNAKAIIVLGTLAALMLAAITGLIITRNIARPLQQLTAVAERITVGDLSGSLPATTRGDEVGALARALERMTQSLRAMAAAAAQIASGDLRSALKPQSPDDILGNAFARMSNDLRAQIGALAEGVNVLGASASEIVTSTNQFAASASESAAAVSEATTTVEEVRQTAQVANQKARLVFDSAQKAAQIAQTGRKSADDVVGGMNRIREQMEEIAASMVRLSEQSHAIGQIIATVEDLATQSNLLAVNASIEAAKAGEHGKGFGVVAQEVKSLAEQSRQATRHVRAILGDIQKATSAAVMATEEGGKAVAAGTGQTEKAGGSIQELAGSVSEAAQAATQIAVSSQQQLVGVDQVVGAMESIKQASTQNVTGAKQLERAARNLNELGQQLSMMVARYQI